jgi:hypothetical protein
MRPVSSFCLTGAIGPRIRLHPVTRLGILKPRANLPETRFRRTAKVLPTVLLRQPDGHAIEIGEK